MAARPESDFIAYWDAVALLGVPLALRLTRYMRNGRLIVHRGDVARLLREHERRRPPPRLFPKGERRQP
jgi:hypothetical protein